MASQRFGITLHGGDNVTLGAPWPKFQQEYSPTSFIGKAAATRKAALSVAQRIHGINTELELARAGRREARVPEITARAHAARADRARLVALRKEFDSVEADVFNMQIALKPFPDDESLPAAIVSAQMRDRLHSAKTDKERATLLELPQFRRALYQGPAELSGVSPMIYNRRRAADIEQRFPEETRTLKDFRAAEEVVESTLRVTEQALGLELLATGVVGQEEQERKPQVEEPAWV